MRTCVVICNTVIFNQVILMVISWGPFLLAGAWDMQLSILKCTEQSFPPHHYPPAKRFSLESVVPRLRDSVVDSFILELVFILLI